MSLILNIDTAVQTASVCLANNGKSIELITNPLQKDHAAWLHIAIQKILKDKVVDLQQVNAIAVSAGPGSYTGLRVGMATAKGLCYVLKVPLIAIDTLKMMANAAINMETDYLCPMIDARRMEVFTAILDKTLNVILPDTNMILNEGSFNKFLGKKTITFFGNGSFKLKSLISNSNAFFKEIEATAEHMTILSHEKLEKGEFAELAYSQPFYGKEFHTIIKQSV